MRFRSSAEAEGARAFRAHWHNWRAAFRTACELGDGDAASTLIQRSLFWANNRRVIEVGTWAEQAAGLPMAPAQRVVVTSARVIFTTSTDFAAAAALSAESLAEDEAAGGNGQPWAEFVVIWPQYTWEDAIAVAASIERRAADLGDEFWAAIGANTHVAMLAHSLESYGSNDPGVVGRADCGQRRSCWSAPKRSADRR